MRLFAGVIMTALLVATAVDAAQPETRSSGDTRPAVSGTAGKGTRSHAVVPIHPVAPARAAIHRSPPLFHRDDAAAAAGRPAKPTTAPGVAAVARHPAGLATLPKPKAAGATQSPRPGAPIHGLTAQANTLGGPAASRPATVGAIHGPLPGQLGGPQRYDARTAGGLTGTGWHRRL